MPKTIIFVAPPAAITSLAASLQAGGNLAPGTTYYYVVLAAVGASWYATDVKISGISNEASATPDAANKTIRLDWTAVAGASGYLVHRTTTPGNYTSAVSRFNKETNNDTWGFTTTNNYFIDSGAATPALVSSYQLSVIGPTQIMPLGLDPRTYGLGNLIIEGGTVGDPITFQNIYDAAVSGGWVNWVKWDKAHFALMAHFNSSAAVETHFANVYGSVFYTLGWFNLNQSQVANSDFIFGTLNAGQIATFSARIFHVAGRGHEMALNSGVKMYGVEITASTPVTAPFYVYNINNYQFITACGFTAIDITIAGFSYYYNSVVDGFNKGSKATSVIQKNSIDYVLTQNLKSTRWMSGQSNLLLSRFDEFVSYSSTYQAELNINSGIGSIVFIDPYHPNSLDYANCLPTARWATAAYYGSYFDIYRSLILRVMDINGNPIANASVVIKDISGSVAQDFNGTDLNLTSDAQGHIWIEKISVTAATTTTITDSSKNWATNQWKGRNVYIITGTQAGLLVKILSNTATQLTLCETLTLAPAVGVLAGIKMEIKQARLTHKAETGAGYGDAYTTKDIKTPHTLTITKAGYQDYQEAIAINRKIDLEIALKANAYPIIGGSHVIRSARAA